MIALTLVFVVHLLLTIRLTLGGRESFTHVGTAHVTKRVVLKVRDLHSNVPWADWKRERNKH